MIFFIPPDGRWQKTIPQVGKCGVQSSQRASESDIGSHRHSGSKDAKESQKDGVVEWSRSGYERLKWLGHEVTVLEFKDTRYVVPMNSV